MTEFYAVGARRQLSRVTVTEEALRSYAVRVQYLDDGTEDRRGGFISRALAHGWAEARIQRHFRLGVPGRLGGAA